ncbi:Fanconi anemia group A protein isoform X2 [Vombatus ursinus]|uniref:FA complementation group A n=1 Tax=Vombatus ursinus TaxID=29139 RepID=A0A4X2LS71_VOMUR|nr:Fanconi anemia group A protein isoform X2 [Vombatus ursinus]
MSKVGIIPLCTTQDRLEDSVGLHRCTGRVNKQKYKPEREQKLQEAAVYLLKRHQNLNDLFLEVDGIQCKKTLCFSNLIDPESLGVPGTHSKSFVVSSLQEQASKLGIPVGILSARTTASCLEQLCQAPEGSKQAALLSLEQRKKLSSLLDIAQDLLERGLFCRFSFCQEVWKVQCSLVLEAVWQLHSKSIIGLEELIESHSDSQTVVDWLYNSLCLVCEQMENSIQEVEVAEHILSDFMRIFVLRGFQNIQDLRRNVELEKVPQICVAVLQKILTYILSAFATEIQEDSSTFKAVKCWLNMFKCSIYGSMVSPDSLQRFFSYTLTQILIYNPVLKVCDAVQRQKDWSFARTCPLLTTLYRRLFVIFSPKELIGHLQEVLETHEVNWQLVLSCVSTMVVCLAEAQQLVKDLLAHLMIKAFESYDLESMITAFLIARQAALEGPSVFIPYAEWFKVSFGNVSGYHGCSKKALVFLFKFLSDLVPFEAPQYMKIHILHPPLVPVKYRSLLMEYITLAKTRLADLKVTIEDMGLYEDLSSTREVIEPHCQAQQDVEKAIQVFEQTGKIPVTIMEASIFRKPYYVSRFLPALLIPRVLPESPDSRMVFIDSLRRADKLPPNLYSNYLQACSAAEERQLEDQVIKMETGNAGEPLEQLKGELEDLRTLIIDPANYDALSAQIAVISEKLKVVLGDNDDSGTEMSKIHLNFHSLKLGQREQKVTDLLLTSFCQNLIASSRFNPPDRQGSWPSLFVKMICGHRHLLPALLTRFCQLIYHQGECLTDIHVLGLAALAVHLNESKSFVPELVLGTSAHAQSHWVTAFWENLLACKTQKSFSLCIKFCVAAISYTLCKFSSHSHDVLCNCLPAGLIKKVQFVALRTYVETRGAACQEDAVDLPWRNVSSSFVDWKKAALCLWKQRKFQELLKERQFQLTYGDWLLFEMEVKPDNDILSDAERRSFHQWALYQQYLPESSVAGGCDGDLEKACEILVETMVDFCLRSSSCYSLENSELSLYGNIGSRDVFSKLQEMVLELELERWRGSSIGPLDDGGHFMFRIFRKRLQAVGNGSTVGERLLRQQQLLVYRSILVGLPPSVLISTHGSGWQRSLHCDDFFRFVNNELKNISPRECALAHDITVHFFRGLLSACLSCKDPSKEVNVILTACQTHCPIILSSAVLWWPRLEPVLHCQWKRHFKSALPQQVAHIATCQQSARTFLSPDAALPSSPCTAWIAAASLHFAVHQQADQEIPKKALRKLGGDGEELLVSLFFFSLMGLLSSYLVPNDGMNSLKSLDVCAEVLGCLEKRKISWLVLFQLTKKENASNGRCQIFLQLASDQYIRLLPFAFYSLVAYFDEDLFNREQAFLYVAVDMYLKLVQLFVAGETSVISAKTHLSQEHSKQVDPLGLITKARLFLLHSIPRCPKRSFSCIMELLATCEELDPEVKAALLSSQQSPEDADLYGEPLLF